MTHEEHSDGNIITEKVYRSTVYAAGLTMARAVKIIVSEVGDDDICTTDFTDGEGGEEKSWIAQVHRMGFMLSQQAAITDVQRHGREGQEDLRHPVKFVVWRAKQLADITATVGSIAICIAKVASREDTKRAAEIASVVYSMSMATAMALAAAFTARTADADRFTADGSLVAAYKGVVNDVADAGMEIVQSVDIIVGGRTSLPTFGQQDPIDKILDGLHRSAAAHEMEDERNEGEA